MADLNDSPSDAGVGISIDTCCYVQVCVCVYTCVITSLGKIRKILTV